MSNLVKNISYSNTFGEWVVTTNDLVLENNTLAKLNYTKDTGTLYLNDPTLGLQVANNAIIAGTLQVQGIGSSGYIQNNLRIDRQLLLQNTETSLLAQGAANIAGRLTLTGSGNSLIVANNASINGFLNVSSNTTLSSLRVSGNTNTSQNTFTNNLIANTSLYAPTIYATSVNATGISEFDIITTTGQLSVGGDFVLNGTTVYNTNNFTINAGSSIGFDSTFNVNRGSSGNNASIKWNESIDNWQLLNVSNSVYYRILTDEYLSDSVNTSNSFSVATSTAVKAAADNANGAILTANTWLQSYVNTTNSVIQSQITSVYSYSTSAFSHANSAFSHANSAFSRANTSSNTFVGTLGSVSPSSGIITFNSNNGITITGSSNTLTVSTPQDLRTTSNPSFNSLALTVGLPITSGGTGATSSGQALTNILPTGTTAGYVLTTGGPGTFYWAESSGGGGGGAIPGTSINSTRVYPSVNVGQTIFTTPTYIPGASQLRVYLNGVRQYNSDYTETSNTSVTLTNATQSDDVVLIEVDGYYVNPYYANNITFTSPFGGIVSSANTIQLAIQDLESRKATLLSPTFTGTATSVTPTTFTSNTQISTTAFVHNLANSGVTFSHSVTGNAGTVTNGVYTNGSYSNPSWITGLAGSKISGDITASNVRFNSLGVGVAATGTGGEIVATGNITAGYSDDRLKNKLGNIENALDKLISLNGFYFAANEVAQELGYSNEIQVGISAQEVQKVLPEVVSPAPIDEKYLTVKYERIIPLLIEAIKELKAEINSIKG
jgi:hypothetical protein